MTRPRIERPTLADVASAAGVSRATVSKVLNGRHDVSPATRARVEHLLAAHAYMRRSAAGDGRHTASSTGSAIDLVVDALDGAHTLEVIRGVSEAAEETGMEVVLSRGAGDSTRRWVERVTAAGRQGIILLTREMARDSAPRSRAPGSRSC
jgi:DNA-binding LacI/PurR family transcriptional regulator